MVFAPYGLLTQGSSMITRGLLPVKEAGKPSLSLPWTPMAFLHKDKIRVHKDSSQPRKPKSFHCLCLGPLCPSYTRIKYDHTKITPNQRSRKAPIVVAFVCYGPHMATYGILPCGALWRPMASYGPLWFPMARIWPPYGTLTEMINQLFGVHALAVVF